MARRRLKANQKKYQDPKTRSSRRRPLLSHSQYHKVQAQMARQRVLVEPVGLVQWVGQGEENQAQAQAPAPELQMADIVLDGRPQSAGSRSLRCQMSILR